MLELVPHNQSHQAVQDNAEFLQCRDLEELLSNPVCMDLLVLSSVQLALLPNALLNDDIHLE